MLTERASRNHKTILQLKNKICRVLRSYEKFDLPVQSPKKEAFTSICSPKPQTSSQPFRLQTHRASTSDHHKLLNEVTSPTNKKRPDRLFTLVGHYNNKMKQCSQSNDPYTAFENFIKYKEMGFILEDLNDRDRKKLNLILTTNSKFLRVGQESKLIPKPKYNLPTERPVNCSSKAGSKFSLFAAKLDKIQRDSRAFKHKVKISTASNYRQYQQIQKTLTKAQFNLSEVLMFIVPPKLKEVCENS